jgi:4-alpha-glucanotransferase
MPFYVAYDSVDVWVHPELFSLTSTGKPRFVSGVPPDYFSATGQLWGNLTYNWQTLEKTGFEWWIERIRHNLKLYDKLRLDHFRGFVAYWQVPANAKTAKPGQWVNAPTEVFFEAVKNVFPSLPFIAEDLGYIDEDVKKTIKTLGIPGMRVLLFAFDGDKNNPHLPENHTQNSVVYTATHDTNTVKGWFTTEASAKEKQNVFKQIGNKAAENKGSFEFAKLALASVADLSVIPLQDVLSLGSKARMNNPSHSMGNWAWRVTTNQLSNDALTNSKIPINYNNLITIKS